MLKLMKYEFKATYQFFVGIMLLILILVVPAVLAGEVFPENSILQIVGLSILAMFFFGYFLLAVISVTSTVIYAIIRFNKSLLGNEGYINHTLPVSTGKLIMSKNITMAIWALLVNGFIFALTAWAIYYLGNKGANSLYNEMNLSVETIQHMLKSLPSLFSGIFFVIWLLTLFSEQLMIIYAAMAVGYSFKRGRKLKSFIIYILMQYVVGTLSKWYSSFTAYFGSGFAAGSDFEYYTSFIFYAAVIVVMFLITRYFLKNRLNLQ
ncbi:MAG: hypothetical protein LUD77_03365 [Clostridiales bacterium]|nr:hypothetical protein [Clostridiales bacterium]